MGFIRLTPENSIATRVAGVRTFVLGGALVCITGIVGVALAAAGVVRYSWEPVALTIIGAAVACIGFVMSRRRQNVDP
jgi:uncharacterized membrane protein